MFRSDDANLLRSQLDRFSIPMFMAQLDPGTDRFFMLALNEHHERETGMTTADVAGKPLDAVLPPDQADIVNQRYLGCIRQSAPLRYREQLKMPRGQMIWDTTLHHIIGRGGVHRVVGSAIVVHRISRDQRDTLAFEDVRYFSTTSSCQLQHIVQLLEAIESGALHQSALQGSAGVLAGLCRSIDKTMQDLRAIAQERLAVGSAPATHLLGPSNAAPQFDEVEKAMSALMALADTLPRGDFRKFGGAVR